MEDGFWYVVYLGIDKEGKMQLEEKSQPFFRIQFSKLLLEWSPDTGGAGAGLRRDSAYGQGRTGITTGIVASIRQRGNGRGGPAMMQVVLGSRHGNLVTQVVDQWVAKSHGNSGNGGEKSRDFIDAGRVAGAVPIGIQSRLDLQLLLSLQLLQVSHCQFQNVGFFQFGDGFSFGLQGEDHQILQFVQALVDACPALSLQQRLHDFSVLVGARHGSLFVLFQTQNRCHFFKDFQTSIHSEDWWTNDLRNGARREH